MSFSAKTEAAYRLIKRDILNGSFLPEEPLRIPTLAARTGLSATPLREALSRLAEQGFATATANRGWRVAGVSVAEVEDLEHARMTIEHQLLADAIAAASLEWEAGIVAAHHCLRQSVPPLDASGIDTRQRWIAAHEAFHASLAAAAPSATLRRLRAQIAEQIERHHQAILFTPMSLGAERDADTEVHLRAALSIPRHTALMEAVLSRDVAAAQAALRDHVATTLAAYRSLAANVQQGERTA